MQMIRINAAGARSRRSVAPTQTAADAAPVPEGLREFCSAPSPSAAPLAMLAPSPAWALEPGPSIAAAVKPAQAFGRTLYPHETLPDAVYALLVKDLDAMAGADPQARRAVAPGRA